MSDGIQKQCQAELSKILAGSPPGSDSDIVSASDDSEANGVSIGSSALGARGDLLRGRMTTVLEICNAADSLLPEILQNGT